MKQAVTPARAGTAREAAVLARCTAVAGKTGQRCRQLTSHGTCAYHSRWVPPLLFMNVKVTRTPGTGKCAMCVRRLGPHVCFARRAMAS